MTQVQALDIMLSGSNVFLTGPPGSGKTYLLNRFIKLMKNKGANVAITATTGIAAVNLDGTTIHSWSATAISEKLSYKQKLKLLGRHNIVRRYRSTDVLVIDEVSMLTAAKLSLVNEVAQFIRANSKPMAGIQLVLVGDFFQLPPINIQPDSYLFESDIWEQLDLNICYLSEQHRQQSGDELNAVLSAIRSGYLSLDQKAILNSKLNSQSSKSNILKLYARNTEVDTLNNELLNKLPSKPQLYKMRVKGIDRMATKALKDAVLSPSKLLIKVGAEVLFTTNNYRIGYVNGDRGRVVGFKKGLPVVRMQRDAYIVVNKHKWSRQIDGQVVAEASQLPLKLAWAITIHKSQGMSLDEAEIDLSNSFGYGMGYVALSRLRNIDGLYLTGLNQEALIVSRKIVTFDKILRAESDKLMLR